MKLYIMYNGLADDFPREAMARTGATLDPSDCVTIPTMCYLIEHQEGFILYDTGWTARMELSFARPEEQRIVRTLARIGVSPEQIRYLILSHLHLDHAGEIEVFPNAEIIVSGSEFRGVASLLLQNKIDSPYVRADVESWAKANLRWRFVDSEYEILDFLPGLKFVTLGSGHAFGILALLVTLPNTGNILIASDAIYSAVNTGPPVLPPGVIMDEAGWYKSFEFLTETAEKYNAQLWYGHDLAQFNTLKKADEGYYD